MESLHSRLEEVEEGDTSKGVIENLVITNITQSLDWPKPGKKEDLHKYLDVGKRDITTKNVNLNQIKHVDTDMGGIIERVEREGSI